MPERFFYIGWHFRCSPWWLPSPSPAFSLRRQFQAHTHVLIAAERIHLVTASEPKSLVYDPSSGGPYTSVMGDRILKWTTENGSNSLSLHPRDKIKAVWEDEGYRKAVESFTRYRLKV